MSETVQMLKVNKLAAILIGIVLAIGIIFGGVKVYQGIFAKADDVTPVDVVVSDINQNSVKVNWSTAQDTQGVIEYGTTPTALNFFAPEPLRTKTHSVDLTLLSPNTTYYFQIRVGENKFDNGGVPWTYSTKNTDKTLSADPTPTVAAVAPTSSPAKVIKSIDVSEGSSSVTVACTETDCARIKEKIGKGCSTQDYFQCIFKLTPAASASATPTP